MYHLRNSAEESDRSKIMAGKKERCNTPRRTRKSCPQEGNFKCAVCKKAFRNRHQLKTHMQTHTGEKPFECKVCGERFTQLAHITRHTRTHTGEKPLLCIVCKRGFSDHSGLIRHMKTHSGEKSYKCSLCEKRFRLSQHLTNHMRTHTGEKPYECDVCKKAFSLKWTLKSHMLVHTGEKPHQCTLCDKAFTQRTSLVVHMRKHTGKKPSFPCAYCNKSMTCKRDLKNHERTHTGEKLSCRYCEKMFTQSGLLAKHVKLDHNIKDQFNCFLVKKNKDKRTLQQRTVKQEEIEDNADLAFCETINPVKVEVLSPPRKPKTEMDRSENYDPNAVRDEVYNSADLYAQDKVKCEPLSDEFEDHDHVGLIEIKNEPN